MNTAIWDYDNTQVCLPFLAETLIRYKKDCRESHFCLFWLENLSLYDRRHATGKDVTTKQQHQHCIGFTSQEEWWWEYTT